MTIGSTSEFSAQLVLEILVHDLARSLAFYESIGFKLERPSEKFAVVRWDDSFLFLSEVRNLPPAVGASTANVRVMVKDVDAVWERVQALGARVERRIGDREFGLRTFIVLDPDGFGVRFAQMLP